MAFLYALLAEKDLNGNEAKPKLLSDYLIAKYWYSISDNMQDNAYKYLLSWGGNNVLILIVYFWFVNMKVRIVFYLWHISYTVYAFGKPSQHVTLFIDTWISDKA